MREIKYRAWDKLNRCWINIWKIVFAVTGELMAVEGIDGEVYGLHQVELVEYTGLKDKNGKEIYEGDRLIHPDVKPHFLPYLVKFGEHTDIAEAGYTGHTNLGFFIEDKTGVRVGFLNDELLLNWDDFRIIGNQWENPELSEAKK